MTVDDEHWDSSQETEVQLDNLHLDWTEGVTATADVIMWLHHNDLPPNVSGVDYGRAVSHPAEGDA